MKNPVIFAGHSKRFTQRRGFTLTELAIVLSIAGIIMGAVWAAVSQVNESNRINSAVQELQTVAQNMVTFYQQVGQVPALNSGCNPAQNVDLTGVAIKAGIIPNNWVIQGGSPTGSCDGAGHPWSMLPTGGNNVIGNFYVFYSDSRHFYLIFNNIPTDACIALLMHGTNCDPSQPTCPRAVLTAYTPPSIYCNGCNPPPTVTPLNWQNMTITEATSLCANNLPYPAGGGNAAIFLYQL